MTTRKHAAILIDDEPDALAQLARLLEETGKIKVLDTFTRTSKALISTLKHQPDLIFLDMQMPGQDGVDFLKDLQLLDEPLTVIMVTAYPGLHARSFP